MGFKHKASILSGIHYDKTDYNIQHTLDIKKRDTELDPDKPCKAQPADELNEICSASSSLQMCFFHDGFVSLSNSYRSPVELHCIIQS